MLSEWPAVGAGTDPLTRARELQRGWERLLADGSLGPELPPGATAGLRPAIVESWRRSLATGLDPTDLLAPIEADESEVLERWFDHPLGSLTHVLTEQLRKVAEESRSMVVVTDASGLVLHRVGDQWLKERAAEMNLVEGARYSEAADGTNGIGTALAADHAFQVFAFEHFNDRHHQWVCSAAPVHDPVSGRLVGVIDLSSLWKTAHPRSLELVTTAARTMEQRLFEIRSDQDARLRRRYGDLMTRSTDLLVSRDGYLLAGAGPAHSKPLDLPEAGGEVVLGDGSVAVAASLGQGEAFLLRRVHVRHAKSAPVEVLERAERHVRELVTEQAALRQVATLVARQSSPDQLFAAVAEQVARVFAVPHVRLVRYEPEGSVVVAGFTEGSREPFPIGSRWPLDSPGVTATVRQTGRPARVEDYAHMIGQIAAVVRGAGMRLTVASPIVVERRLWGAMVILSPRHEPFPENTEARLTDFTELVATAIANAESQSALEQLADALAASRRRIVAASDETRRQIERNLHDGTQQRLVSLGMAIRSAQATLPPELSDVRTRLSNVADGLVEALEDLQEISRGIHPAILSKGGLAPALRTLAQRSTIPVNLDIEADTRLAEPIEVAAYFAASEALANAAKHSQASRIDVSLAERDGRLLLSVRDDGAGGADPTRGSGLVGLTDRVEALGGSITVDSRRRNGTEITVELPVEIHD